MFAKLLKRKTSRTQFDVNGDLLTSQTGPNGSAGRTNLKVQYAYQRPDILGAYTEEDFTKV